MERVLWRRSAAGARTPEAMGPISVLMDFVIALHVRIEPRGNKKEATAGFEPAIGVLQTPALPLGYVAMKSTTCSVVGLVAY